MVSVLAMPRVEPPCLRTLTNHLMPGLGLLPPAGSTQRPHSRASFQPCGCHYCQVYCWGLGGGKCWREQREKILDKYHGFRSSPCHYLL